MKRSELNQIMKNAVEFIDKMNFKLPPFAFWSPEEWAQKGHEYDEIRDNMLGWDITDFGSGDFLKIGLSDEAVQVLAEKKQDNTNNCSPDVFGDYPRDFLLHKQIFRKFFHYRRKHKQNYAAHRKEPL